jgi:cysteine desulfuration protein SufE
MGEVQDEIIEEMSGLGDRLDQYEYLVAQGRALQVPADGIRTADNAIPGCQASVWVRAELIDGRLRLSADSDALINKGMIALLLRVLDGRTPAEIVDADLYFLDRTGLRTQLSPARANGLGSMVKQIRAIAERSNPGSSAGKSAGVVDGREPGD